MSQLSSYLLFIVMLGCLFACTESAQKDFEKSDSAPQSKEMVDVFGNYVSAEYDSRTEGYDWISVQVMPNEKDSLSAYISIRSRGDKKKPTCTLDVLANREGSGKFTRELKGAKVNFEINNGQLIISTERPEDQNTLSFYCSGGGSFLGSYQKIEGPIDQNQIDKSRFFKHLDLQGITFSVSGISDGSQSLVTVAPSGLEIVNDTISQLFPGEITNAEIEDLNSDGSPELLIYMTYGENKQSTVIAYSVNNLKSMSNVYLPPISEDKSINTGYHGFDEFSVVEKTLSRRFPIQDTDSIRQVNYILVNGEASRLFEVKSTQAYISAD